LSLNVDKQPTYAVMTARTSEMETIGCTETSVHNYQHALRITTQKSEEFIYSAAEA
jgi:hypothetical protein